LSRKPVRLAYFVSHPIQYQAPLLRKISEDPSIDLTVFFASDISVREHFDSGFDRKIAWDIDLLGGYRHEFLPAIGDLSQLSLFRPFSYGVVRRLLRGRFDAVWCHSYARLPHLTALIAGRLLGMKVFLRDEASFVSSNPTGMRRILKVCFHQLLKLVLSGILTIGTRNYEYYETVGFRRDRLFRMPYAVDNDWFAERIADASTKRETFRADLGLEPGRPVILFASKLQPRKRAQDLIRAFRKIVDNPAAGRPYLLIAGDGELRDELQLLAEDAPANSVHFLGFRTQAELPPLYDICDVFVLPSNTEPWGLVTNEAMNAGRAIIATTEVGSARDLVRDGENGFIIEPGDIDALADRLLTLCTDRDLCDRMGKKSLEIIENWDFNADIDGLREALQVYFGDRIADKK
jgi:glycosyltransferase involved in cell wall biosynthesis